MPKSRMWPYPLAPGTNVIAKVLNPQTRTHVQVVGTVVRVVARIGGRTGCTYAVKTTDGRLIQTWSSQTIPIDTSTEDGADLWMDAIEQALREGDARYDGLPQPPAELEVNTMLSGLTYTAMGNTIRLSGTYNIP